MGFRDRMTFRRTGGVAAGEFTKPELRRETRARKRWAVVASLLWLVAAVFLLLVNLGQTRNTNPLNDWYFFRFDVSNIIPASVTDASIANSYAKSIGLHDFYDVSMWGYCEGYYDQGVTSCTTPQLLYWFDPVAILQSQLLRGATIDLPQQVVGYLTIVRVASQVMFGCFFAAVMAAFVSVFLAPLVLWSRLATLPVALFSLLTFAAAAIGAAISTGMWVTLQHVLAQYAAQINIVADLGTSMFAFQWVGVGCALFATLIQLCLACCCTSRRDIRTGRRHRRHQEKVPERV